MTPKQYAHAKDALGWSHERMAEVLGKEVRTSYRYASGKIKIPALVGREIRRLVRHRLTLSGRKFEQLIGEL